ncbi:MAG: HepT-like ribonuclease domain-containing protein [Nitrososphaerales archaeon]
MRYNIVVLVESIVSLCIHVATEAYGKTLTSYREAVRFIAERLNMPFIKELKSLISLRNLLIHRYWTIGDEKVYEALKANFKCVEELIERIRGIFKVEG